MHRLAPQAKSADEKLGLYGATIAALEGYGDDRGRDAWEEKLLVDFKDDQSACAGVFMDRGARAYYAKDFEKALQAYRKVSNDYPRSAFFGEAQFNIGTVLQRQRKYDDAILAYYKLFLARGAAMTLPAP